MQSNLSFHEAIVGLTKYIFSVDVFKTLLQSFGSYLIKFCLTKIILMQKNMVVYLKL